LSKCAEFALLRNRRLGPLAVTVLPIALARRAAQCALSWPCERPGLRGLDHGRQKRPQCQDFVKTLGSNSIQESQAFACCVVEWLNRNPAHSPAGRCLGCGDREHAHDPLLPYGVEPTGHAWLHSHCWPAWYEARKAKATAALAAMGITAPVVQSMRQEEQSEHPPSDAAIEPRTAKTNLPSSGK
jgi:hypothetical protein